MTQYICDIHSHILPGYDDGAENIGDSIEMAAMAAASGVGVIVATPHSYMRDFRGRDSRQEISFELSELQDRINAEGIPIKLLTGMEVLVRGNIVNRLQSGEYLTLNGTKYVLVEFVFGEDPGFMSDRLFEIERAGYIPVIAHPERYEAVQDDNFLVFDWTRRGYLAQINKGSVLGAFGDRIRHTAINLLRRNLGVAVASDAHSPVTRTTSMDDTYEFLADFFSEEYAHRLLVARPREILRGNPLTSDYKRVAGKNNEFLGG